MRHTALLASVAVLPLVAFAACSSSSNAPGAPLSDAGADALVTVTPDAAAPDASVTVDAGPQPPFQVGSPWPKFRGNVVQDALSTVHASTTGGALWAYQTGKGIFSSPVVGADGTVYVGSADRTFYALKADGTLAWSLLTGEIIDSAALLDDQGHVYFGSGDGNLRALDAKTGAPVWSMTADLPTVNNAYLNWFEGNVAMGVNGDLYVPNDNYFIYDVDRDAGTPKWKFKTPDQTWSLPAVDTSSGTLFVGNNNMILGPNTFSLTADGGLNWSTSSTGTIAASPMLTGSMAVLGAFDGYVHAIDQVSGDSDWTFATRDHVYASVSKLPDGTLVAASADGSLYGLDATTGASKWQFDTTQPIRSSPSIDADGNIYFGGGDGRLYVVGPNGKLRWSILLINADRNDLNASPALANDAIVIGGESGQVFSVPYEYCLRPAGLADARCTTTSPTLSDGAQLVWTTSFGNALTTPPTTIDPTRPITLTLVVRDQGAAELAILDSSKVTATVDPPAATNVVVSGDGKFVTIVPQTAFTPSADGTVSITVTGPYLTGMSRTGLKLSGGNPAGTATFTAKPTLSSAGNATLSAAATWEVTRLAVPLPTVMPSYNQIGFDSLTYLVGLAELDTASNHAVAWMVGGKLETSGNASVDPTSKSIIPLDVTVDGATLTMNAPGGLDVQIMSINLPFTSFRMDLQVDAQGQNVPNPASLIGSTTCAQVPTYGTFLDTLGLCNPQTDIISFVAGANVLYHGAQTTPAGVGTVAFTAATDGVTATLTGATLVAADHLASVLVVDPSTSKPLSLGYALDTVTTAAADGTLASVNIPFGTATVPSNIRVYLMVDTAPVGSATLTVP